MKKPTDDPLIPALPPYVEGVRQGNPLPWGRAKPPPPEQPDCDCSIKKGRRTLITTLIFLNVFQLVVIVAIFLSYRHR